MLRRALVIVPLLSAVMLSIGRDNYFSCTMFPGPEGTLGQRTFAVHYAVSQSPTEQVVLLVSDQETYPCMNYQLESGLSIAGHTIRVSMSGRVLKPDVCLTATGPAQYRTALPIAPGTYSLEFERSGSVDRYRLTVTASAIEIATLESSFTRPT